MSSNNTVDLTPLRTFIMSFAAELASSRSDADTLLAGTALLRTLIATDNWLPPALAQPHPERYMQYLLHCDSRERFSVVSFVWGPGQSTPIHDHTVWGLIGVLRGAEKVDSFTRGADGRLLVRGPTRLLGKGEIDIVGPAIGDIHRVANAYDDRASVSIHVYGDNIGAVERFTYDAAGRPKRFISSYANAQVPNIWDRSKSS